MLGVSPIWLVVKLNGTFFKFAPYKNKTTITFKQTLKMKTRFGIFALVILVFLGCTKKNAEPPLPTATSIQASIGWVIPCLSFGFSYRVSIQSSGSFAADNVFQIQLSDTTGAQSFANPLVIARSSNQTFNFSLPSGVPSGRYRIRITSSNPALTGSISNFPSAQIGVTGTRYLSIFGTPDDNLYPIGVAKTIGMDLVGCSNGNANMSIQLSDSSGNFGSPVTVGTYDRTIASGVRIQLTIPAGTTPGRNYRLRSFDNNGNSRGRFRRAFG
jgi:hypothetical protein